MIYTMNLAWLDEEFARFGSEENLRRYMRRFGLSGIEYLSYGETMPRYSKDLIRGVHLHIPEAWMDLWYQNEAGLISEYVTLENAYAYYGKDSRQGMIRDLRAQLLFAEAAEAEYVVLHVTEIKLKEVASWDFAYTDEAVIRAAAELVNAAIEGIETQLHMQFLFENLWWPGLKLTDPAMTSLLIELVHYDKKGLMLDTGHLLHTNPELKDEKEGLAYIHQCLDKHGDLLSYIKGVHLNQSITGEVMKSLHAMDFLWAETYEEQYSQIMEYIFQIDQHKPYVCEGVKALLERIQPEYVTLEFISRSQEEHEAMMTEQMKWL